MSARLKGAAATALAFLACLSTACMSAACGTRLPPRGWSHGSEWPAGSWTPARPYERGMDERVLARAVAEYAAAAGDPHELLIIKDGFEVFRAARYPYPESRPHAVFSCTKSIVSLLVGIALDEGTLPSLDARLSTWFPAARREGRDSMRLGHLLSMTSGVRWRETGSYGGDDSYMAMLAAPDPVEHFFSLALADEPGTRFQYNSGAAVILGRALEKACGMPLAEYALDKLFVPLGIRPYHWQPMADGGCNGAGGLYLSVDDLARIGLMVARGGVWRDTRIVSQRWLDRSTARLSDSRGSVGGSEGYGLMWWMGRSGGFYALGFGGQYILIHPESDLVVVCTGGLFGPDWRYPESVLYAGALASLSAEGGREDGEAILAACEAFRAEPVRDPEALRAAREAITASGPAFIRRGDILEFEDGSIFRLGPPGEASVPLFWQVNGNAVRTELPLDGSYALVDLGSFGIFPKNEAMLSLGSFGPEEAVLTLRRLGVAYAYEYAVGQSGGKASWSGRVSYQNQPFERYRGRILP